MTKFIPGLELAEGYYRDIVGPLLAEHYPDLKHAAALMGGGSDVLGYDTEASMDHDWGPRFQLFLPESCDEAFRHGLRDFLRARLPFEYRGFPTHFAPKRANEPNVRIMTKMNAPPVMHMIEVTTPKTFSKSHLGFDATEPVGEKAWLTTPQSSLLEMTAGRVFLDELNLTAMRERLSWYPREIWVFLLGCTWWRLRRFERTVGQAGQAGDELGAQVLTAQIVRDFMRLAYLMERRYTPYEKWFGMGFRSLACAATLDPHLTGALAARSWQERDAALARGGEILAQMHNALGVTKPVRSDSRKFLDRTFRIIGSDKIARACFLEVPSPYLSGLFQRGVVGNIDLITDSVDVLISTNYGGQVLKLFDLDEHAS